MVVERWMHLGVVGGGLGLGVMGQISFGVVGLFCGVSSWADVLCVRFVCCFVVVWSARVGDDADFHIHTLYLALCNKYNIFSYLLLWNRYI